MKDRDTPGPPRPLSTSPLLSKLHQLSPSFLRCCFFSSSSSLLTSRSVVRDTQYHQHTILTYSYILLHIHDNAPAMITFLASKTNKYVAGPLLSVGLSLRFILGGGVIRPNRFLDAISFVPWAQRLVSIQIQDEFLRRQSVAKAKAREPSTFDKFVDQVWDRYLERVAPPPQQQHTLSSAARKRSPGNHNNPRLEDLEKCLRPALIPNERWVDVTRWMFNFSFLKWARLEYLSCKYGEDVTEALAKNHMLRAVISPSKVGGENAGEVLGMIFGGPSAESDIMRRVPPPMSLVRKALKIEGWSREKNTDAVCDRMKEIAHKLGGTVIQIPGSDALYPDIPIDADLSSLNLEEIIELAGGHVANLGPFNVLCERAGLYEFWTHEYCSALASYLLMRATGFGGDTVVVDIGAGDGMLTHFLRSALSDDKIQSRGGLRLGSRGRDDKPHKLRIPDIFATDDGSWSIVQREVVEKLSLEEAMAKYSGATSGISDQSQRKQLIIICSWMPMGEDWTAAMRSGGADEIILIGEADNGNCGHNWKTWGNPKFRDDEGDPACEGNQSSIEAPYVTDGWVRQDLDELSMLQYSRFDSKRSRNSMTVSFRRKKP